MILAQRPFRMCGGTDLGVIYVMNYTITIDQEFAIVNGLSLVDVSCLAACITLTTWSRTVTIDGKVWYMYSHAKMVQEFPLLFGVEKRVYKNLKALEESGYINLIKIDKANYLAFTDKMISWNRPKADKQSENGLLDPQNEENSPKTDYKQSENGLFPIYKYNNNTNNKNTNNEIKKHTNVCKENPSGFSQPTPDNNEMFDDGISVPPMRENANAGNNQPKASVYFGFKPETLDVRQSVIDKADKHFANLIFPFDSEDFKREIFILLCQPKWRGAQKSFSAIQSNLNGLSKYPEEFARILVNESISKGWAALEYDSTPDKFRKWEAAQAVQTKTNQQSAQEYADMMAYLNNDF